MKLAIVCDDLIQNGGAEKVFLDILELYPNAVVYSSVISKKWQQKLDSLGVYYRTSFIQKLPFSAQLYRFYSVLYFHVLAFESFKFDQFDMVLSMSSRYAHLIFTKPQTKHVCYMHSVGRMFWETPDYFNSEFWKRFLWVIKPFLFFIRQTDYIASQRVELFIANSSVTKNRINKYYHRDSIVLNPSIDTGVFKSKSSIEIKDYYLVVSRLVSWKRFDIVIEAFKQSKLPLKVVGSGSDLNRLKILSSGNKNIEFLGHIPDAEKLQMMAECKALIFPQYEDFGITPIECMASGRPVIAYGRGGVKETVISGKTGVFFYDQTNESLLNALNEFDSTQFISHNCFTQALKFDKKVFKNKLKNLLDDVYLSNN